MDVKTFFTFRVAVFLHIYIFIIYLEAGEFLLYNIVFTFNVIKNADTGLDIV